MYQLILTFFHHHQDNKESTLLISSYSHFIRKCTYKRCDTCDTLEKGTPNKEGTLAVQESSYHYPLKIWSGEHLSMCSTVLVGHLVHWWLTDSTWHQATEDMICGKRKHVYIVFCSTQYRWTKGLWPSQQPMRQLLKILISPSVL